MGTEIITDPKTEIKRKEASSWCGRCFRIFNMFGYGISYIDDLRIRAVKSIGV